MMAPKILEGFNHRRKYKETLEFSGVSKKTEISSQSFFNILADLKFTDRSTEEPKPSLALWGCSTLLRASTISYAVR